MPELEFDADIDTDTGAQRTDETDVDPELSTTDTDGRPVVDLPTHAGRARLTLPADADPEEVAAIVSAVAVRLREDESTDRTETEEADRWRLAGRLDARRRFDLPRRCRRGGEWSAASRCP